MNVFNRVVAVLSLLAAIALLSVGILQPTATIDTGRRVLDYLSGFVAANLIIYWIAAAVLLFLALVLLILELRRPRRQTVKVHQISGSVVELATESVARSLEYHLAQVAGITRVQPEVTSHGGSVRVILHLETDPEMDVPGKSEEVVQLTREVIEGKLGLKLAGSVQVTLRQAPYGRQSGAAGQSRPQSTLPPGGAVAAES